MSYDGIQHGQRVEGFGYQKINAKVVDNVLNARSYFTRLMGMGVPFSGKTDDTEIKVTDSSQGEFYTGMETLNSAATDTTITLSFGHTAFAQPIVIPMLEAFANAGPEQAIDMELYKLEEAPAEAIQKLGLAAYGTGSGNQPLGLEAIVDNGTNIGTIGGQSRTTYPTLKATVTASGGVLTLLKLGTLDSTISASGIESETPNINVTTKTIWDLYEQLLHPNVRAEYQSVGYNQMPVRGNSIMKMVDLKGAAGFTVLSHRGQPVLKDDACTSGVWYKLNERYIKWMGRTVVPEKFRAFLTKVNLGTPKTIEGVAAAPSQYNGWFFQEFQMSPNQAGIIARYHVIGQTKCTQFRRQGKLTGILNI